MFGVFTDLLGMGFGEIFVVKMSFLSFIKNICACSWGCCLFQRTFLQMSFAVRSAFMVERLGQLSFGHFQRRLHFAVILLCALVVPKFSLLLCRFFGL